MSSVDAFVILIYNEPLSNNFVDVNVCVKLSVAKLAFPEKIVLLFPIP